jgi:hypothetical protein
MSTLLTFSSISISCNPQCHSFGIVCKPDGINDPIFSAFLLEKWVSAIDH